MYAVYTLTWVRGYLPEWASEVQFLAYTLCMSKNQGQLFRMTNYPGAELSGPHCIDTYVQDNKA